MDEDKENIENAFKVIKQTFIETAQLLKDFDDAMIKDPKFKSLHSGHEIGTESSNSLNVGEKWLKRFAMRYYLPEKSGYEVQYLLGICVSYNFENQKEESPKLILGIIENAAPETNREKYYYWWIPFLYDSEKPHNYTPIEESLDKLKPNIWYEVDPSPSEMEKIVLFKKAHLYFMDLLDVNSKETVNKLAKELSNRYKSLYT